jgi:hypothetical protein
MASLAEIRARLAAQENKSKGNTGNAQSDNSIYPHWNIDEGTTATVRFLPDGDSKNEFFWVEKNIIKLPFNGVKGQPNVKQVIVQVPCNDMYVPNSCPVLAEVRPWYKDESLKEMANKYWKKRSYIFQGFVRQNPLGDDKVPANPIRRFAITSQIFPIIKGGIMDPEILEMPTDYMRGLDFNIKKTSKGGYADYSTSSWARRESPLTEAELEAINAHGLFNLRDFLPKQPTEAELRIIKEMFEASVDGQAYDPDRWGQYYKPYGLDIPSAGSTADSTPASAPVAQAPATAPVAEAKEPWDGDDEPAQASQPVQVPTTSASSEKAQDILAMIRARQNKA